MGLLRSMGIHKRSTIYPKNLILLHFTQFQDYKERSRQSYYYNLYMILHVPMCACMHAWFEYFKLKPHLYKFISIFILSFSCIFYVKQDNKGLISGPCPTKIIWHETQRSCINVLPTSQPNLGGKAIILYYGPCPNKVLSINYPKLHQSSHLDLLGNFEFPILCVRTLLPHI